MTDVNTDEQEPDYTYALDSEPTSLQTRFADFLMSEEVGYDPSKAKTKEQAFREGVRMAVQLRIPFQASRTNREATEQERLQRAEERERLAAAKEEAKAAKQAAAAAKAASKSAPVEESTEETPAATAKPAKRAGSKPAKAAAPAPTPAAAPAPARRPAARRAPARAAAATSGDAPF